MSAQVWPGVPFPLGATWDGEGVNFSLFSEHAVAYAKRTNHTSDQHPWFQRARQWPAGSAERDFYVWSDTHQNRSSC